MENFETATIENFACSKKRGENISTMHGFWSEQEMNKTLQRDTKYKLMNTWRDRQTVKQCDV